MSSITAIRFRMPGTSSRTVYIISSHCNSYTVSPLAELCDPCSTNLSVLCTTQYFLTGMPAAAAAYEEGNYFLMTRSVFLPTLTHASQDDEMSSVTRTTRRALQTRPLTPLPYRYASRRLLSQDPTTHLSESEPPYTVSNARNRNHLLFVKKDDLARWTL